MEGSYRKLAITLAISFVLMYLLTFAQTRQWDHFYVNFANGYMTLVMVAPVAVLMLVVMWSMFKNKKADIALTAGFAALFVVAFASGRTQALVGDERFLKSMIPHHSRAILVCQESNTTDPEIEQLCREIVQTQRQEIERMQEILERH
ncbi:DUF305 domain-containing protein [Kineococcus auxinigenes]|uniref:DUF305 domain-containing protein n=1 Tax=unclassified Kineococcus TaxID=2621656 RepID=UPI003D7EB30A